MRSLVRRAEARHDFGFSLGFVRCAVCDRRTRNRGCASCEERMCKTCFRQHPCTTTEPPTPGSSVCTASQTRLLEFHPEPRSPASLTRTSSVRSHATIGSPPLPSVATWQLQPHPRIGRIIRGGYQRMRDPVPPQKWGISITQVQAFLEWSRQQLKDFGKMSVRQFIEEIIKPKFTEGESVALSFHPPERPLTIKWLVSHCWEEDVEDFLEDVIHQAKLNHCARSDGIFICFLCLFQGSSDEVLEQVSQGSRDIKEGCFAKVLRAVKSQGGSIWVIPNENMARLGQGLYQRLWPGWEAYQAKEKNIRIQIHPQRSTSRYLFGTNLREFSLKSGTCGNPAHQTVVDLANESAIRSAIESGLGWAEVDTRVKVALLNSSDKIKDIASFLSDGHHAVQHAALFRLEDRLKGGYSIDDETISRIVNLLVGGEVAPSNHSVKVLACLNEKGALALVRLMYSGDKKSSRLAAEQLKQIAQTMTRDDSCCLPDTAESDRPPNHLQSFHLLR